MQTFRGGRHGVKVACELLTWAVRCTAASPFDIASVGIGVGGAEERRRDDTFMALFEADATAAWAKLVTLRPETGVTFLLYC